LKIRESWLLGKAEQPLKRGKGFKIKLDYGKIIKYGKKKKV